MTPKERVKAALGFENPDRVPRDLWATPYVTLFRGEQFKSVAQKYPSDIRFVGLHSGWNDEFFAASVKAGSYTDSWGSIWHIPEPGIVGWLKAPALADYSVLDKFKPPPHLLGNRNISLANKVCEENSEFTLSDVAARPFERLQFLRGQENTYLDIGYGTAEFRKLLEIIHEFYVKEITSWSKTKVDGIFFMDDWGDNKTLFINPDTWREIFKPLYKQYCDIIHAAGKFAFFHSDGQIESIFNDLVEIGIDAVNSQLFLMNIESLAEKYKGEITFWGEVDRQHTLPFGTPKDIRKAVRRLRNAFDDGTGGVIAQCEWGRDDPEKNIETFFESWL